MIVGDGARGTGTMMTRTSGAARLLLCGALAAALAGCSAADSTALTLASTKGPAQLLRNTVASYIPAHVIAGQGVTVDESEDCGDGGRMRSWRSSVQVLIHPSAAKSTMTVFRGVRDALAADGWHGDEDAPGPDDHEIDVTTERTTATVHVIAHEAVDASGEGATIDIEVDGPCVATEGADSDEVKNLENRD